MSCDKNHESHYNAAMNHITCFVVVKHVFEHVMNLITCSLLIGLVETFLNCPELVDGQWRALKKPLSCGTANPPLLVLHYQPHSQTTLQGLSPDSYRCFRPKAVQANG